MAVGSENRFKAHEKYGSFTLDSGRVDASPVEKRETV